MCIRDSDKLEYAFPKEGYVFWMDNVVLLKDAPNRENALKFMDFLLEPETSAAITNFAQYISPVAGAMAMASDDVKSAPELNPPAEQGGQFVATCEKDVQEFYDRIWTNLKK